MSKFTPLVALGALFLVTTVSPVSAITVGGGTGIPLEETDTAGAQPRTNVDQSFIQSLPVGTYQVNSFAYAAGQSGSVTPFIAANTGGDTYQVLAQGNQVNVAGAGTQTVGFGSTPRYFSVTTAGGQVFGGITNPPGSQNPVFLDNNTGTSTDHANAPPVFTGPGTDITVFSNPNLNRTYAFAIDFSAASPNRVGAGVGIHHELVDDANGSRTNIDETFSRVLQPGIYVVKDWEYAAGQAGHVTPFIARSTGADTYQTMAVGSNVVVAGPAVTTANFGGSNTLIITAPTTVYGGITNPGGNNNPIYLDNGTTATTDHDGTPDAITAANQAVNGISNPNLGRTYAFAINYDARVASPRLGADITIAHEALDTGGTGPRMNVDDSFTLTLGPGQYNLTDFSFSTGRAGQVQPFIATFDGTNYNVIAVGDTQTVGAGDNDTTVAFGGPNTLITLLTTTTLYGGITNPIGDNPVYTDLNNGFTVDHDGSAVPSLTGPGQLLPISGFSNPNLGRSYAFSIGVQAQVIPEPATLSLLGLAGFGLLGRRRRA